ncbi:polysaccharide biosynthesis/export family protein [Catenovulum sp. SX2]|uniref:polysaccharide biosynthesis/export family protein n=1 Tax=Catenovulum sp. SX2 TaxID=3398614 RepID=UPI003F85BF4F
MRTALLLSLLCWQFSCIANDYKLGVGDQIQILVYEEADLTIETTINDNGQINFPFLGNIMVVGKTPQQVQTLIANGLKGDYLLHPVINVSVVSYRPFYIHGEVKKPGAYPYQPGLNVDQAIALAGGLTDRASEKKITIKSEQESLSGQLSSTISPGDTVTIKQSFF